MTVTTMPSAREVARKLKPHVDTLLLATAYAQCERERVDNIAKKVLANMGYDHHPRRDWMLPDDVFKEYNAKMLAIHLQNGFADAAKGYCPALVAESLQTEAEWALIEAALEFFPECDNNTLLCGTKNKGGLETRREYIDLLIKLVVNSPGYVHPLHQHRQRNANARPSNAND